MTTFVIGDIHGHYSHLIKLLYRDAGVINQNLTWCGKDATLCFVGDYVNRGPDSIKVLDFMISLQIQAELNGAKVIALQGNHEHVMLSTKLFGDRRAKGADMTFNEIWEGNGGAIQDIEQLTPEHIAWISHLPAMALVKNRLLVHGDAMLYTRYGQTVEAVNKAFENVLRSYDLEAWDHLLRDFNEHRTFWENPGKARAFLSVYGGEQIIHGHSTIGGITGQPHETVTQAFVYADGLCVDVDGGIYKGGPGFIYEIR